MLRDFQRDSRKFSKILEWTVDVIEKPWGIRSMCGDPRGTSMDAGKDLLKNSVDFAWVW